MDGLLSAIIQGGPANIDVTVNGQPLSSLIKQLGAALSDHNNQIAELRDYTYRTDEQMWNRIARLEDGVSKINKDLGFAERQEEFEQEEGEGDSESQKKKHPRFQKTTHQRVFQLEDEFSNLDSKRKGLATSTALEHNHERLMRRRFHTWLNVWKRNSALRSLMNSNSKVVQSTYFDKWAHALKMAKRKRYQLKSVDVLERFNQNRLARHYYELLLKWREYSLNYRTQRNVALMRAVEAMRSVSVRGFMRRKWLQWMGLVARRRHREDQTKAALRMAAVSSRSLVRRYFSQWLNVEGQHNLRRRQLRTATALAVQSARILAGRNFQKWLMIGKRKKQRRMGSALIPRMAHDQSVKLASRYYIKLWRNAMARREHRSRSQIESEMRGLTQRFENLSGQLAVTNNQSQEAVSALQRLSQQQQQLANEQQHLAQLQQQQQQQGFHPVRNPTPPGRRQSPFSASATGAGGQRSGSQGPVVKPVQTSSTAPASSSSNNNNNNEQQQQQQNTSNLQQLAAQPNTPPPASISSSTTTGVETSGYSLKPPSSNANNNNKKPPAQQLQTAPQTGPQSGASTSAMQLGTHVSQVNMRGGGSGEVSRVSGGGRSGSQPQQQQQQGGGLPSNWLDNPEAAWSQMRAGLEGKK